MSPSYREPSRKQPKSNEDDSRSIWSTTSILAALAFLTILMGLLVYGAVQGVGPGAERAEIRATR